MKASVQFPPYKGEAGRAGYNKWQSRSPSPSPSPQSPSVKTMVEHFSEESRGSSQGTRTVTRTITPSGEMSVYASQSSVRFKMTSKSSSSSNNRSRQELGEAGSLSLPRPSYSRLEEKGEGEGEGEDSRDLYPVTVTRVNKPPTPHRTVSLRDRPGASRRALASPDFNILHRDTGRDLRTECQAAPQQGYSVVVAIDFGELNLLYHHLSPSLISLSPGTTFSGYAYSFTSDPDNINLMRKWEGDDPGNFQY